MSASHMKPVGILTGFLGSGKTTLLRRWLASEEPAGAVSGTAVLINEFGAIGLDHLLVGRIDADTVLLDNGCICCAIRGELKEALLRLVQPDRPAFRRVIIETTGLAAPGPILATLLADKQLRHHFWPSFVCTVVDAVHAQDQRARRPEWMAQISAADTLCLSKTDLVEPHQEKALRSELAALNPLARITAADSILPPWRDRASPRDEIGHAWDDASHAAGTWLAMPTTPQRHRHDSLHIQVHSFCLIFERPLEWFTLTLWLTLLLHHHGRQVLRMKGILSIVTEDHPDGQPTILHGIGHLMHPPEHLPGWPDEDRRSRLVFITEGLDEERVRSSWDAFERFYEKESVVRSPIRKRLPSALRAAPTA